jgi:hypothetical protein
MIANILIIIVFIAFAFVVVVALQPSEFRVTRSARIGAPPETVFPHVNDLRKWEPWSPWAKLDPNGKTTFEGPGAGTGAVMSWVGNDQLGEGRMTIIESRPNQLIRFKLEFIRPFQATNESDFTFKSEGRQTVVTWGMSGSKNFMFKAVGLFMNCDKMLAGQFDQGLAQMKSVAESSAGK